MHSNNPCLFVPPTSGLLLFPAPAACNLLGTKEVLDAGPSLQSLLGPHPENR